MKFYLNEQGLIRDADELHAESLKDYLTPLAEKQAKTKHLIAEAKAARVVEVQAQREAIANEQLAKGLEEIAAKLAEPFEGGESNADDYQNFLEAQDVLESFPAIAEALNAELDRISAELERKEREAREREQYCTFEEYISEAPGATIEKLIAWSAKNRGVKQMKASDKKGVKNGKKRVRAVGKKVKARKPVCSPRGKSRSTRSTRSTPKRVSCATHLRRLA